jgi:hypothetical protein
MKLITEQEAVAIIEEKCASASIHSLFLKGVIMGSVKAAMDLAAVKIEAAKKDHEALNPDRRQRLTTVLRSYCNGDIKDSLRSLMVENELTFKEWIELRHSGDIDYLSHSQFEIISSLFNRRNDA